MSKTMKKKIISLLTLGAIMISLIGCGKTGNDTSTTINQSNNVVENTSAGSVYFENDETNADEESATTMQGFGDIAIGEYVTFGHYEQDNDYSDGKGNDPIEWLVLDHQDGRTLLVSRCILAAKKYNDNFVDVTWEDCTLRAWMNGEFYNESFTDEEKAIIALTHNENPDPTDDIWGPYQCGQPCLSVGGNDTDDYVFCLSTQEVVKYFGLPTFDNQIRQDILSNGGTTQDFLDIPKPIVEEWVLAYVTPAVNQQMRGYSFNEYDGVPEYYSGSHEYWLRSPGPSAQNTAAHAGSEINSQYPITQDYGVRPAIWVND